MICLAGVVATGWLALSGQWADDDAAILRALRQAGDLALPAGPPWGLPLARAITLTGSYAGLAAMALLAAFWIWRRGARTLALQLVSGAAGAILLAMLAKALVMRPRPDITPHLAGFAGSSFPSSHALLSMAILLVIALTLGRLLGRSGLLVGLAIAASLLIGLTRLYLGVHWPSDVLAGWLLGGAWGAGYAAALRVAPRRDARSPGAGG